MLLVWVNQTPRQLSRTGVDRSTLCDVCNTVSVKNTPSLVMIGSVNNSPPCGLSRSLQVAKKRKSTSPGLVENTHKLDAVVYRSLSNDLDSESIFSKVIDHKLYNGSSNDLYSHCRMNFVNDPVQTQAPHFMYMRLPAISTLNESGVLGTPDTRIRRPGCVSHCRAPDHVFGETTAVGMSVSKSGHDYSHETDFEIWRENQKFEHQNISMSRPPLE